MSIREELRNELKAATRERDQARLDVIRAVETDVKVAATAKGFDGELDDALYVRIIAAYSKKMTKARAEYEKVGERGREMADKLAWEVEYLARWLPRKLDEEATLALVQQTIAALGVTDPGQAGRVMGAIMKAHGKDVDGALVNQLVRQALTRGDD